MEMLANIGWCGGVVLHEDSNREGLKVCEALYHRDMLAKGEKHYRLPHIPTTFQGKVTDLTKEQEIQLNLR